MWNRSEAAIRSRSSWVATSGVGSTMAIGDVAHVGAHREAEDQHLDHREEDQDRQRLPVPQQVQGLLPHEPEERPHAAVPGRVSLRNTSSSVSAPTARRTSAGVPMAAIAPFTMMEIRRQYSASSR